MTLLLTAMTPRHLHTQIQLASVFVHSSGTKYGRIKNKNFPHEQTKNIDNPP